MTTPPRLRPPPPDERSPVPADVRNWIAFDRFLARLRPHRFGISLLIDALVVVAAWNLTYLFRIGFDRWFDARPDYDPLVIAGLVAVYLVAFAWARIPGGIWRFSGFGEVRKLLWVCVAAGAVGGAGVLALRLVGVPRAVLALHPLAVFVGVCGVRLFYRMAYEHARERITGSDAEVRRALVLGAGEAASRLLSTIHRQGWSVLGLLDDDPAKHGGRIAGIPVLGALSAVTRPSVRGAATHLIVAMPSLRGRRLRALLELAGQTGLPVLSVPSQAELQAGREIHRVREIEPDEVLGREPVVLDDAPARALLQGRTVLVTGAGGSIGSELCRQIARFAPARLVLFEHSEFNLYTIEQALGDAFGDLPLVRCIGDVKDRALLQQVVARWRPQVVFHAAAYKHVPLMEEPGNDWQCLLNNVVGTWNAARIAAAGGVERFVLISTDKAVNPTSVMGATKRVAEMVISSLAERHPATRFVAVRFGNVLGSSGSVIPKFKEQIAHGGPITVTHPEIIRYFMTIPEAARLVLQAGAIGESGQVMVLDMGEPVRIVDLARNLIRLSGRTEREVPIAFSGLRPGEKMYEELLADHEHTRATTVEAIRIAELAPHGRDGLLQDVAALVEEGAGGEGDVARAAGAGVGASGCLHGTSSAASVARMERDARAWLQAQIPALALGPDFGPGRASSDSDRTDGTPAAEAGASPDYPAAPPSPSSSAIATP